MISLRIPTIRLHGISGYRARTSSAVCAAASPMISNSLSSASTRRRSPSICCFVRPRTSSTASRAASSMCWRRISSSCRVMQAESFGENPVAEIGTQGVRGLEVHPAAEHGLELLFHPDELEKVRCALGLELDEHVNVALGAKVVAQHRAEERQPPHMMPPAEVRNGFG